MGRAEGEGLTLLHVALAGLAELVPGKSVSKMS